MLNLAQIIVAAECIVYVTFLLLLGSMALPYITQFLMDHGLTGMNYNNQTIPTAVGLLVWLLIIVHSTLGAAAAFMGLDAFLWRNTNASYLASFSTIALLGFIDDAVGTKIQAKGIAGHWRLWSEHRRLSTGLVKAGGIFLAAVPAVHLLRQVEGKEAPSLWYIGATQVILLALMANGLNLLDLRPGRALKGFFTMLLLLFVLFAALMETGNKGLFIQSLLPDMLPVICGALVLLLPDLQGKLMLGDTGANLLGFALGCWAIAVLSWEWQCVLLFMLLAVHGFTWRWSLSALIERNRLLLWFDRLGREGTGKI